MKNMKRNVSLFFALMLCAALLLTACGGQGDTTEPSGSAEAAYRVTVRDALGNPYTDGVIVRFLSGGEQAAMQVVDGNGVVEKTLEKGDYTVELMFTGDASSYYYDPSGLTLSAEKTELEVILARTANQEAVSLYVQGTEYAAYPVSTGCTYVNLTAGDRNYFLFTPTEAGTYEFSVIGGAGEIGYYGTPFFVLSDNAADATDKGISLSIKASMIGTGSGGTSVLVLGVDAGSAEDCILAIQRIGDPAWDIADEPWTVYQTTAQLATYTAPSKPENFDLTADSDAYNLVYNEADGFYHLNSADGPLVLAYLAKSTRFLDSFQFMLENGNVCKFFYNDDGSFLRKENYNECLLAYLENVDEDYGVYPLTRDLKYIFEQRGDYIGWWNRNSPSYRLLDDAGNPLPDVNPDIAWLSLCCYLEGN
ncbi:MAG: hypothetical protein ACI4PO_05465 [Faecousia sp.]